MAEAFAGTRSRYFPSLMYGRRSAVRDAVTSPASFAPSPLATGFPMMFKSPKFGPKIAPGRTEPMLLLPRIKFLRFASPSIAPISTVWIKLSPRSLHGVPHVVAILEAWRHTDTIGM